MMTTEVDSPNFGVRSETNGTGPFQAFNHCQAATLGSLPSRENTSKSLSPKKAKAMQICMVMDIREQDSPLNQLRGILRHQTTNWMLSSSS